MAAKNTSGRIILPDLTAAQLAAQNPVLKNRQLQFEGDTGKAKRGDGITHWNSLPYVVGADGKAATVKVGTVTTLQPGQPATVNNSGTENAVVLNFGIPQGQAGSGGGSADPNIGKGLRFVFDGNDAQTLVRDPYNIEGEESGLLPLDGTRITMYQNASDGEVDFEFKARGTYLVNINIGAIWSGKTGTENTRAYFVINAKNRAEVLALNTYYAGLKENGNQASINASSVVYVEDGYSGLMGYSVSAEPESDQYIGSIEFIKLA